MASQQGQQAETQRKKEKRRDRKPSLRANLCWKPGPAKCLCGRQLGQPGVLQTENLQQGKNQAEVEF